MVWWSYKSAPCTPSKIAVRWECTYRSTDTATFDSNSDTVIGEGLELVLGELKVLVVSWPVITLV
jgi:hypothetical protein